MLKRTTRQYSRVQFPRCRLLIVDEEKEDVGQRGEMKRYYEPSQAVLLLAADPVVECAWKAQVQVRPNLYLQLNLTLDPMLCYVSRSQCRCCALVNVQ